MKLAGAAAKRFLATPDRAARAAMFYGPNRSAVAQACDDVMRALLGPTPDDFALTRLDEDALRRDRALLGDQLAAQSLLGGERLVRVRVDGDSAAESLIDALGDLEGGAPGAFLLIEGGDLAARSKVRAAFETAARAVVAPFYEDDPETLAGLARAALAAGKVRLTPAAQSLLDAALPADRALLRSEIEKIALFAHGRTEPVDVQDVAALLAVEQEAALDDATLAVAAGRAGAAVEALEAADAGGISAIKALERRLLRLLEARTLVESGSQPTEAVQKLRPPVFWKERDAFIAHVRSWSLGTIAAGLDILWKAQLRAMAAGAPQDLIAADAFRAVAGLASRRGA